MSCKKICAECPWSNDSKNNRTMIEAIIRWFKNGSRKTITHRCHMVSTDLWNVTNEKNICKGSLNYNNENIINASPDLNRM